MKAPGCLLDIGPLAAFLNRRDSYYKRAGRVFAKVRPPLRTCEAVISEACFLTGRSHPVGLIAILDLRAKGVYEVALQFEEAKERIAELMFKYRNVPMSFANACLVACAEKYQEPRIISFDEDFKIYRWGKGQGKKFQILA